jgi:hypothetical protein
MSEHRLWMAVRRRTLNHHLIRAGAVQTACGRWTGTYGLIVDDATVEALDSPPCPRCWPKPAQPPQLHIRPVVDVALPEATP